MSDGLSQFSTDDLLAEIVRRRNAKGQERAVSFCDDCRHFKPWERREDPPDDYNACGKGHHMTFRCPRDDYDGRSTGFVRRVCEDREMMTDAEQAALTERLQKVWQRLYGYASREEYEKGLNELPNISN